MFVVFIYSYRTVTFMVSFTVASISNKASRSMSVLRMTTPVSEVISNKLFKLASAKEKENSPVHDLLLRKKQIVDTEISKSVN